MLRSMVRTLTRSGRLPELLASSVAIHIAGLGSTLYSTNVLNRYVSVGITSTLVTLTVGVVLAIVLEVLLRRGRQRVLDDIAKEADERASEQVFNAFSKPPYAELTALPLSVRREALNAPAVLQQLNSHANFAAVLDVPFLALYVLAMAFLYPPLGAVALAICALTLGMGVMGERRARMPAEEHAKAASRSQQMGQFLLAAGETLRGLPMMRPVSRRWAGVQGETLSTRRGSMVLQGDQQSNIQMVGQLLTVSVYGIGAAAAVHGGMTTGALIGASILAGRAFALCSRAAQLADPVVRASRAHQALSQVHALEPTVQGSAQPGSFSGRLTLDDVAFSYSSQPVPVFERLSLELSAGQVLVITGPNGAGKSTLVKLVAGVLQPARGLVRADGIELRQLAPAWWHKHAGYAPQEPVFFDGTLRENLCLDREVDDDTILAAMREMGLEAFLASDPEGLDRHITSHDTGLAMGLRRRLVLVRALLGQAQVLVLDEPTEGLDAAGHAAVAKLLNRLVQEGRTLVIATNEAFILRAADKVLDMSQKPTPALAARAQAAAPAPKDAQGQPSSASAVKPAVQVLAAQLVNDETEVAA